MVTLHFPEYPDVPLEQAPLGEVICQVRFSPIFRIETDLPSELQDALLEWFPHVQLADDDDPHQYQFLSRDNSWAFWLGVDAFTLSTRRYTVWDEFGWYLAKIQATVQKTYRIASYRRIGLRYLNLFTSENTHAASLSEISQVLRPELVMPLREQPLAAASELTTHLVLDEAGGKLAIRVGGRANPEVGGPVMFLDLDFYVAGELSPDGLVDRCKRYHDIIYSAFRWSLNTDALEPVWAGHGRSPLMSPATIERIAATRTTLSFYAGVPALEAYHSERSEATEPNLAMIKNPHSTAFARRQGWRRPRLENPVLAGLASSHNRTVWTDLRLQVRDAFENNGQRTPSIA